MKIQGLERVRVGRWTYRGVHITRPKSRGTYKYTVFPTGHSWYHGGGWTLGETVQQIDSRLGSGRYVVSGLGLREVVTDQAS